MCQEKVTMLEKDHLDLHKGQQKILLALSKLSGTLALRP